MSFGFSVSNFITVGKLIQQVTSSLRASSISEYRELTLELHGLQQALHQIEHLRCSPIQEPAVNGIRAAALACQYPLHEFAKKLKRFESLDAGKASRLEKVSLWIRKLQCMQDEVTRLRAYLTVHVGSSNMRLITQGLCVIIAKSGQNTSTS